MWHRQLRAGESIQPELATKCFEKLLTDLLKRDYKRALLVEDGVSRKNRVGSHPMMKWLGNGLGNFSRIGRPRRFLAALIQFFAFVADLRTYPSPMKTSPLAVSIGILIAAGISLRAADVRSPRSGRVVERGAHFNVVEATKVATNDLGEPVLEPYRYTVLGNGLKADQLASVIRSKV
jgi:hypothetical protein